MASKKRPGSAKRTLAKQEAARKRGAPGKRFIDETADQSLQARRVERQKVERMAEVDRAHRTVEEVGMPASAVVAELVQDVWRLARTLAVTPYRLYVALRRHPSEA